MPLSVKCPSCATVLAIPDTMAAGGAVRCPKCTTVLRVPVRPAAAAPAPPMNLPTPPARPAVPPSSAPAGPPAPFARPQAAPQPPSSIQRPSPKAVPPAAVPDAILDADDVVPPKPRTKSNTGLLIGILGCAGLVVLACGGGVTYGIYKFFSVGNEVARSIDQQVQNDREKQTALDTRPSKTIPVAENPPQARPPEPKPEEKAPPPEKPPTPPAPPPVREPMSGKPLDVSFIPADFNAALVIHPSRIARSKSPLLPPADMRDKMLDEMTAETGIDPRQVEQLLLLVEPFPGGNVAFMPAGILRFAAAVDGKKVLAGPLKEMQEVRMGDKVYYNSKSEKMARAPLSGFIADDKTVLLATEPTLKKMLAVRNARSPLIDRLRRLDLDHDACGVFVLGPFRPVLAEMAKSPDVPPQLGGMKTLSRDLDALTLTADLDGGKLLEVVLHGTDEAGARSMEQLAQSGLDMGKQMYGAMKPQMQQDAAKEVPPDVSRQIFRVADQITNDGIKVSRNGKDVTLTLPMPKDAGAP